MIDEDKTTKKIRVTPELCVYELDIPKLAALPIVLKAVVIGKTVSKRAFVKLTQDNAMRGYDPLPHPMWADLITGTLYGMDGRSTSPRLHFKGAK